MLAKLGKLAITIQFHFGISSLRIACILVLVHISFIKLLHKIDD